MAITLVVVVSVAVLAYAYATPYLALERLKRAADARDAQTVNQYVDFPALRDSLKQQVVGLFERRLAGSAAHGNPLAAIVAMVGTAVIGPLVDAYATPDGVAALLNGMPPRGEPGERPPAPPDANAATGDAANAGSAAPAPAPQPNAQAPANTPAAPPQPPQTTAGYRGLNEFVVTYQHGVGDARYSAILRREGLFTWKLAAVDLAD
ncbi:MAG TPA: DUF2939 domain-containing protein [Paraburkholderia sp.]|nr:DUF2939 domain-containing protein [Paraburkholderia sp.]